MSSTPLDLLIISPVSKDIERLNNALVNYGLTSDICQIENFIQRLPDLPNTLILLINLANTTDRNALAAAIGLSRELASHPTTCHLRLLLCGVNPELSPEIRDHKFNDILFGPLRLAACLARIKAQARLITITAEAARRDKVEAEFKLRHLIDKNDGSKQVHNQPSSGLQLKTPPNILITGKPNGFGLIEKTLSPHATLVGAMTNSAALEYSTRQQFNLMIINGGRSPVQFMELIETIKRNPSNYPLPILVVAHPSQLLNSHIAYQAGVTDIINAPVNPAELLLRSQTLIEEQRLRASMSAAYHQTKTNPCYDALTKLYSFSFLSTYLGELEKDQQRTKRQSSLISLHVNNLTEINMQYGYLGGDLVLRQCAEIITQTIRGEDLAARLSGTAFAISLPETSMEIAASAQQRIMSLINHTPLMVSHEHPPVKMEVSTGIIAIETGKTVEETIKALHAVSKQEPKIKAA